MSVWLYACRFCGYDARVGRHEIIEYKSGASHIILQCLVPPNSEPVTFARFASHALPNSADEVLAGFRNGRPFHYPPDIGADVPGGGAV